MKNQFTDEQLELIRDIFADQLSKSLDYGHRDQAQEELDIINVVQDLLDCEPYESLNQFRKDDSGTWYERKEPEEDKTEAAAIKALIAWAKSDETKVTDEIQTAVDNYCSDHWLNSGRCDENTIAHRKIGIDGLIIGCIYALHSDQLAKLDTVKDQLARHLPPKPGAALNSYDFTIIDTDTKQRFTVSSQFQNANQAKQWAADCAVDPYYVDAIQEDGREIYSAMYEGQKLKI